MPKLPPVSAAEVITALQRAGFVTKRQNGSHAILQHPETKRRVAVPRHGGRDLKTGTLHGIVSDAGLSVAEFIKLLGK